MHTTPLQYAKTKDITTEAIQAIESHHEVVTMDPTTDPQSIME